MLKTKERENPGSAPQFNRFLRMEIHSVIFAQLHLQLQQEVHQQTNGRRENITSWGNEKGGVKDKL